MKIKGKLAGQLGALLLLILCAVMLPVCAGAAEKYEKGDDILTVEFTLPEETGYTLHVEKLEKENALYPEQEEIDKKIGKVCEGNGLYVYDIYWVDGSGNRVDYTVFEGDSATKEVEVTVTFKDGDKQLGGSPASRKLLVMNVNDEKELEETELTEVVRDQDGSEGYSSFKFNATTKGPYVFASKMVYEGYINDVKIKTLLDGTADFDQELDQNDYNRLVRTNDSIKYTLELNMQPRDTAVKRKSGRICFEMTMENDITAAEFSTEGDMKWLEEDYKIEYLAGDDVLYTRNSKNELYDKDGKKISEKEAKEFKNKMAADSLAGADSYQTGITKQRLTGSFEVVSSEGNDSILSMNKDCSVGIRVLDAKNGEKIQPVFRFWFEGNEQNWGSEKNLDNKPVAVQSVTANCFDTGDPKNTDYAVTVKSAARFNLQLLKNADMGYKGWFDLSTGDEIKDKNVVARLDQLSALEWNWGVANPAEFKETEDGNPVSDAGYENYRYGRITSYGITLQMYDPEKKNHRGFALPVGAITFDLHLSSSATKPEEPDNPLPGYTSILWDYKENVNIDKKKPETFMGKWGRNLFWDNQERSPYAKGAAPSNSLSYHNGCYNGGTWDMTTPKTTVSNESGCIQVEGDGGNVTYEFKVSGYDFDLDTYHFPAQNAGNSGDVAEYTTYEACFSAGQIQVLTVMPRTPNATLDLYTTLKVNNLQLSTRDAGTVQSTDADLWNMEGESKDNVCRDKIDLYSPGGMTKGNSFNKRNAESTAGSGNTLCTDYWGTAYDASAFAGEQISVFGYGQLGPKSDYHIKAMNLLQLFDSRALQIDEEPKAFLGRDNNKDTTTKTTFLYVADPKYEGGYDTNQDGVQERMNTVQEEDLLYFETLEALEQKGLTCVGVLMEVRDCDLAAGDYHNMRIPVKVNGEDKELVGKTVSTVNGVRVWVTDGAMKGITWADGEWDEEKKKNVLAGYETIDTVKTDGKGNGFAVHNLPADKKYTKAEYQDGNLVKDTHTGGVVYGNSLLILDYRANVQIDVENPNKNFNVDMGQTSVEYILKNIKASTSPEASQGSATKFTNLRIETRLDEKHLAGEDTRISVLDGTYTMMGYEVEDHRKETGKEREDEFFDEASGEKEISISSNKNAPTYLGFMFEGKRYVISVYAQRSSNGKGVEFVIEGAPVGIMLPEIRFTGSINPTAVKNNDNITTTAYISGDGDNRAYDETKGNKSSVTIGIIHLTGTSISKGFKASDQDGVEWGGSLIEMGGIIPYTVSYTNSGNASISLMYFYDLLPYNGDIRQSGFKGQVELRGFHAKLTNNEGQQDSFTADVNIYYSTTDAAKLKEELVKVFDNTHKEGETDTIIEEWITTGKKLDGEQDPIFQKLGKIDQSTGNIEFDTGYTSDKDKEELAAKITCIFVRVRDLSGNRTITLEIPTHTNGNKAADVYGNIAHSWVAVGDTLPLQSNIVQSVVVGRNISGVVWYDRNYNGIRDAGEALLPGVKVTLFKENEDGKYEVCTHKVTRDALGSPVPTPTPDPSATTTQGPDVVSGASQVLGQPGDGTVVTDANGAYSFPQLSAGKYIVAFQKEGLKDYTGATTYQQGDSETSSDGVALSELSASGIDTDMYAYAIQYSVDQEHITLHTLTEIDKGNLPLENYEEKITHQDIGLVKLGDLAISKTVQNDDKYAGANLPIHEDQAFDFTVTLSLDGKPVTGTFDCTDDAVTGVNPPMLTEIVFEESEDGKTGAATVSLTHGQTLTIKGIPEGAAYTVKESPVGGYTVTSVDSTGTIRKDTPSSASFTNTYDASGEWTPEVTKTLRGRDMLKDEEFTFTLTETTLGITGAPYMDTATVSGGTNGVAKEASFDPIEYDLADVGKHTYTISETGTDGSGLTYDESVYTATVTVTDKGDGTLDVETAYKKKDAVTANETDVEAVAFENTYAASGSWTPEVSKELKGRDAKDTDVFYITVWEEKTESGQTTQTKVVNAHSVKPDNTSTALGTITYDLSHVGVHKYILKETDKNGETVKAPVKGVTYDKTEHTIWTNVTDNGDGTLEVEFSTTTPNDQTVWNAAPGDVTFTNTYAASGSWTPKVSKTLTGRDMLKDEEFTFTLTETTQGITGAPYTETVTVSGGRNGEATDVRFKPIEYALANVGKHTYTICENNGADGNGLTYDKSEYRVTVEVTDNHDGTLKVEPAVTEGRKPQTTIAFTNTYMPAEIQPEFKVRKTFGDGSEERPKAADFTFELTLKNADPQDGVVMPADTTARLTMQPAPETTGEATFDAITFKKTGTYTFEIRETKGDLPGYTYDESTWTLTVQVTDDGQGQLAATQTYEKEDGTKGNEAASFTNVYKVSPTQAELAVAKAFSAESAERPTEETFTFTLEASDKNPANGAALPNDATATIKGAGEAAFGKITFSKAGEYAFEIRERDDGKPGYTYDNAAWTATVTVEDKGGKLEVTGVSYARSGTAVSDAQEASFTNGYDVKTVSFKPAVKKTISGGPTPEDKEFSFVLSAVEENPEGALMPEKGTLTVQGEAQATFDAITFTRPGEYRFVIWEQEGEEPGYSYDDSVWTLNVLVEERDAALTVADAVYTRDDGATGDEAGFVNAYAAGSLKIVKKTIGGRTPDSAAFTISGPNGYQRTVWYGEFIKGAYTLDNLPLGTYTVTENSLSAKVSDMTLTVGGDQGASLDVESGKTAVFEIVNTYEPDTPKTPVRITKVWKDGGYADRPNEIHLVVRTNDDAGFIYYRTIRAGDVDVHVEDDTWSFYGEWNDHDYVIEEVDVPGYVSDVQKDGNTFVIVNTYIPDTGDRRRLTLFVGLLAISLAGIGILWKRRL